MADCCTPGTGFPNAALMEQLTANNPVIWEEICAIQQAILAASSQCQLGGGQMCTTVAGTTPMTFVNGVSSVTVTNGGSGYFIDRPALKFIPPVGSAGALAAGTITTNGGAITSINVTAGGTGYLPVPATMSVSSVGGTLADLAPIVDALGAIVDVNIISGGTGYTVNDTVTATRAVAPNLLYVDAIFRITSVSVAGEIIEIAILNPGSGYQNSVTEVEIVSSLNSALPYPLGAGFKGTVIVDGLGVVSQVVISNTGTGYANFPPYLVITSPGTGATTSVTLTGTAVSAISVVTPGTSYTTSDTGTVFNPPTASPPNPPASPAVVVINTSTNTYGTTPSLYWQVWAGTVTNKSIQLQMNSVLSYFAGLGYTIVIQSNPATGNTIAWRLCW